MRRAAAAAAAAAVVAPAVLWPLSNPDLFWHLSAYRRMRELGAIPAADWLSWTRAGETWTDFEWASQLLFGALHAAGGMGALWVFKCAVMAAAAVLLWKTAELYGRPAEERLAAAALWGAAMLTRSDIRPELFTTLFFGGLVLLLERRRLGLRSPAAWALGVLFCAWANLHPGFVYGLLLLGAYAAAGSAPWAWLGAAALGAAVQPDPAGHAAVILRHVSDLGAISARIVEWMPPRLDDPWHAPFFAAVLISFVAALAAWSRRVRLPLGPLAALLFFCWSGSRHARMTGCAAAVAVPFALAFRAAARARERRVEILTAAAACLVYSLWCGARYGLGRTVFNDRALPVEAADFLERSPELASRRLYNPWGWGGYLGWRLGVPVYQDGRYLFHSQLAEESAALESPESWQDFLEKRRIGLALLQNAPILVEGRPWHEAYMPRARWELRHEDARALVFARRP